MIGRRRGAMTAATISAVLAGAALMGAGPARADDGGITPVDTHGLQITDYPLSFNEGAGKVFGLVVTPSVTATAAFAMLAFGLFIAMAWMIFSVFKLFVRLDWIPPLVDVAQRISESISAQLGQQFVFYIVGGTMLLTVVIFALRNHAGRAWHHVAITLVFLGIGVAVALPVGEAAHLLKMGRDIAVSTGSTVTPQTNTDATALLIDKFVREPTQRWQYGQDLDSLGCGQAWDTAVRAIRDGQMDIAKIKDVPLSCPGGAVGEQMHNFAMNPTGAVWLGFLNPLFMAVVGLLVGVVVVMLAAVAVSAIIHAALIKPGLLLAGTTFGQSFLARNIIDGYTAAAMTCGLLLLLFVGGSVSGLIAATVPSSQAGMLITLVILLAFVVGARRTGRNLRTLKNSAARTVLPHGAPNAYGPPSKAPQHARRMAVETARQVSAQRRNSALRRAITSKGAAAVAGDAVAPEVMIPAQAMGVVAQHVFHAAAQYHAHQGAQYQSAAGQSGTAWGAGGRDKRAVLPGARSVNYNGAPAGGGAAVSTARQMARRSSQRRTQNTGSAGAPGAPGTAVSTPRPPAPLRTSTGRLGASSTATPAPVPVGAAVGGRPADVPASPPMPPAASGGSGAARRSTPSSSTAAGQSGVPQAIRRSGAIRTARDAARNYRDRR
ncbi:MAG: hypothetical protein AB7G47_19375 [Mycolicibacterium sp.]|uniref:hypothetical protein n=1 Tax=Mycolicibacterium sp. TaxID=2320850 RepID=UPI003D0C1294